MDTEESRKRHYRADEDHWSEKRPRQQQGATSASDTPHSPSAPARNPAEATLVLSVEDMIAVPLDFLFRVVPQPSLSNHTSAATASSQPARHKPLLSRAEAQCLLSVAMLAYEMDSLTALASAALRQRRSYGSLGRKLEKSYSPYLRPIVPLLQVVANQVPTDTLDKIQSESEQVVADLRATAATLRQFSEQNWNLSESLMDSMSGTSGELVAKEKRRLSDVQEEVFSRIESLLDGSDQLSNDLFQGELGSMKDYCARLLAQKEETLSLCPEASSDSPMSEASERVSQPLLEEKENAPSQSSFQQRQQIVLEEVYGSPNGGSETPSCRGPSNTQNAAEVLSSLGKVARGGGTSDTP